MEFDRGMVGVLIVVLSLMASVGLGVITNIETEMVTKDVTEYVADITGAYSSGKEQSYTEYNPSSNFNGYSNQTVTDNFAVDFVESAYTNNYPLMYTSNTITTSYDQTTLISALNLTPTSDPAGGSKISYAKYNTDTKTSGSITYILGTTGPISDTGYYVSLQDVITALLSAEDTTDLTQIDITIPVTVGDFETIRRETQNYSLEVSVPLCVDNYFTFRGNGHYATQSTLQSVGASNTFIYKYTYKTDTGTGVVYLDDTVLTSGAPSLFSIYCPTSTPYYSASESEYDNYELVSHNSWTFAPNMTMNNSLTVEYQYGIHTQYIDTRYGVGIRGTESDPETVVWSNGQQNGVTDIAFSTWNATNTDIFSDSGESYSDTGVISYYETNATDTFTVSRAGGHTYVALNGNTPVDVGTWKQIQLTFDNINGVLTAHPIQTWDNFNNYSISPVSVEIGEITKANLKSISWTADNSLRLEVVNTHVFFNTYGVVMVDPEITISNLWPSYNKFMVNITKVATIGDSVTIGVDTYDVNGTTVTINNTALDITDLKLYYTKTNTGWNITAESGKNSTTFTENSTYLKFTGSWYFVSSFYNVVTKQVQERLWDPSTYNFAESHMFFWMAGILLLLSVIGYKLGYLDGLSIIILIATELILVIIGGTT